MLKAVGSLGTREKRGGKQFRFSARLGESSTHANTRALLDTQPEIVTLRADRQQDKAWR
jgi:hypothetical protein